MTLNRYETKFLRLQRNKKKQGHDENRDSQMYPFSSTPKREKNVKYGEKGGRQFFEVRDYLNGFK